MHQLRTLLGIVFFLATSTPHAHATEQVEPSGSPAAIKTLFWRHVPGTNGGLSTVERLMVVDEFEDGSNYTIVRYTTTEGPLRTRRDSVWKNGMAFEYRERIVQVDGVISRRYHKPIRPLKIPGWESKPGWTQSEEAKNLLIKSCRTHFARSVFSEMSETRRKKGE